MKKRNKLVLALIVIILILAALLWNQYNRANTAQDFSQQIKAELKTELNKNGQEKASILVLRAEKQASLLKLEAKDTVIKWLQRTVKDYKGALNTALVLSNQTGSKGATKAVILRDTTIIKEKGGTVRIIERDIYKTSWANEWEEGYILASHDSIYRDIKIKNDYQITLGNVSNGWFKPKEYEVQVLNLNPNTKTKELRSFQIKERAKKLALGVQIGYGLGVNDWELQPYVGLGVQLNLLGIK